MDTILMGKNSTMTQIQAHPLLHTLDKCLKEVGTAGTPQQIVDALWYVASIVDRMGPPAFVIKNPYKG